MPLGNQHSGCSLVAFPAFSKRLLARALLPGYDRMPDPCSWESIQFVLAEFRSTAIQDRLIYAIVPSIGAMNRLGR